MKLIKILKNFIESLSLVVTIPVYIIYLVNEIIINFNEENYIKLSLFVFCGYGLFNLILKIYTIIEKYDKN